jgi:hypothetical protein
LWAATVKAEIVRVRDDDDQMTGAEVHVEMAKVLVTEDDLHVSEYTISHPWTFPIFLKRRIDSAGTFMVKAELATTILRAGLDDRNMIPAQQWKRVPAVVAIARAVNDRYRKDRFDCFRVWGPAGVVRNERRGPSSDTENPLLTQYAKESSCCLIKHRAR